MIDLIAEIGWNHMGDMELAKHMIDAAKESGATYAKFQTWSVDRLKPGPWDSDGRREIYEKAELSQDDHFLLKEHCDGVGVNFLTSCFSMKDIQFISQVSSSAVKIPSTECNNKDLVMMAIHLFSNVFVSTGASQFKEWKDWGNWKTVRLMHCVSIYPCPAEAINLPKLKKILSICPTGGYSGHYDGIEDALAAISIGAQVVEKHFTLDKSLPGRDNKFAIFPEQFKQIREFADEVERMRQDCGLDCQLIEEDARENYNGRWNQ